MYLKIAQQWSPKCEEICYMGAETSLASGVDNRGDLSLDKGGCFSQVE